MSKICKVCGLPEELCVCNQIAMEQQSIRIYALKRRFGKIMTIIEGIDEREIDLKDLAKKLKSKLACGGTYKDGKIELQGDHRERVKEILVEMGFPSDSIDVR